jgi:uridylate kinase
MIKFKRILLKLSGEALMGSRTAGIDKDILDDYASQIAEIVAMGVETGIVIGGGNIFRGVQGASGGIDRVTGDRMGMLATVINGMALQDALRQQDIPARLFTSVAIESIGERFVKEEAMRALEKKEVAIFSGGTGNPFFTTDTAAVLRALETGCDVLLKGTRVNGVYSADPEKDPAAVKYDTLSFDEAYEKGLKIMDLTAFTMCNENDLPVVVYNMNVRDNLRRIIGGDNPGTLVHR